MNAPFARAEGVRPHQSARRSPRDGMLLVQANACCERKRWTDDRRCASTNAANPSTEVRMRSCVAASATRPSLSNTLLAPEIGDGPRTTVASPMYAAPAAMLLATTPCRHRPAWRPLVRRAVHETPVRCLRQDVTASRWRSSERRASSCCIREPRWQLQEMPRRAPPRSDRRGRRATVTT
jgi:hypothetical protein